MSAHSDATAEAEVKIRVTTEEFAALPAVLRHLGFVVAGVSELTDHYLEYTPSLYGSYNLTRLRRENDRFVLTKKHWVIDGQGQPVRLEEEQSVSDEAARDLLRRYTPKTLHKRRLDYQGRIDGRETTISLDALELGGMRYFLECEMLVPREESSKARRQILAWLREHLPVHDFTEAPSMLEMLLEEDKR